MSEIIEVVDYDELQEILTTQDKVVVKFTAPARCVPCRNFAPHFKAAAEKSDATFVSVDVDHAPWATAEYGIRGIPTVLLFEDGEHARDLKERTAPKLLSEILVS